MHNQHLPSLSKILISFFEQVSLKNPKLLISLNQQSDFNLEQQRWCFTLIQLHGYLQKKYPDFSQVTYPQFRQLIYSNPINQCVKPYGAHISIVDNQKKVDQSTYAMIWQDEKNDGT